MNMLAAPLALVYRTVITQRGILKYVAYSLPCCHFRANC